MAEHQPARHAHQQGNPRAQSGRLAPMESKCGQGIRTVGLKEVEDVVVGSLDMFGVGVVGEKDPGYVKWGVREDAEKHYLTGNVNFISCIIRKSEEAMWALIALALAEGIDAAAAAAMEAFLAFMDKDEEDDKDLGAATTAQGAMMGLRSMFADENGFEE
ncbi:hypothetical protein BC829DRAFT_415418 [Chytridium lagenaria]|nr:hypothetical protein BC829DRAFT_415418 [Chytridium lagenaria]